MTIKEYELLPAQRKFLNLDHDISLDISIYQGGFGSGKTFCGSLLGILLCLQYPGIKGLVVAETFPLVDGTTKEEWFKHLDAMGFIREVDWKYNVTDSTLRFIKLGSSVKFSHCADPYKLRSREVGFIQIEEASQIQGATFKELLGRLRQTVLKDGKVLPRRRLFAHTNPEASKGWIYEHFIEKTKSTIEYHDDTEEWTIGNHTGTTRYVTKLVEEDVEGTKIKVMYRLVLAPTTQNFFLPPEYIAGMKSSFDGEFYRINVLGEFGDYTSGLVTKGFNKDRQLMPLLYNPNYPLHLTCDFNVDPNCWFIAQQYDGTVYFLDEIIEENTNTEKCIQKFINRYPPQGYPNIIVNGDASGGNKQTAAILGDNYAIIINNLRRAGYKVGNPRLRPKNPDVIVRINAWNAKMQNAAGEHSIFFNAYQNQEGEWVTSVPRLIHAIENLKFAPGTNAVLKPTRAELRRDVNIKYDEHVFDGASYLVEYYFPVLTDRRPKKPEERERRYGDDNFNMVGGGL